MFDILVYPFETQPGACPESSVLARKLSAIGFEQEDISAALDTLLLEELLSADHHSSCVH